MLFPTKILSFATMILFCGLIYYSFTAAKKGKEMPKIRRIPALEAIDEAIGRATELGAPVHFSPGRGGLVDEESGQMLASFQFLSYIARQTAKYKTQLITTICDAMVFPVAQEVVRQAYIAEGAPERFTPETVRFLSNDQMAYCTAVLGIFQREKPAANFMIGAWYAETMLIAEGAAVIGAMQVGGTARLFQLPYLVVSCDYCLLGEEVFAGGAYLGKDPVQLGSLAGQDLCKLICCGIIVVGVVTRLLGWTYFHDIIGKLGK